MYNVNEDMQQALSNLSAEERAVVDAIAQLADAPQPKSAEGYKPAAVTCTLTHGWDGANFNGWIHYTEGGAISFTATRFTRRDALPLAMAGGLPIAGALERERLAGKAGTFVARGRNGTGVLVIKVDGQHVIVPAVPLGGAGLLDWIIEGELQFAD